jgi:hypothetical protein
MSAVAVFFGDILNDVQDHIPVKGRWGCAGFLSTLELSTEDCYLTSVLRELGAGEISSFINNVCPWLTISSILCKNQPTSDNHASGDSVVLWSYGKSYLPRRLNM